MTRPQDIRTQLGAARTRLILDQPFLGALVMHLPLEPADPAWCETTATDARAIYYNPDFIARLSLAQTQFALAHEALHCALGHFARRSHRTRQRWDAACDHAVNLLLAAEGLRPPPGALGNPAFRGLSAEEIYPLLPADCRERTLDRHLFDETDAGGCAARDVARRAEERGAERRGVGKACGAWTGPAAGTWDDAGNEARSAAGGARPASPGPVERAELTRRWSFRIVSAAQRAQQAGKLGGSWLRLVGEQAQPRLPWRSLLARYLACVARDDYSFQRLSRREGEALLPRLSSGEVDLQLVLDTSGSIGRGDLARFAAEVDALKAQIRARVTLHVCDERLDPAGPWTFAPWEPIVLPQAIGGGGGTRFGPVFEWLERQALRPDLLLYFTDAEGEFPRHAPQFPVIWLVKGRATVPWGERVQLG